MTFSFLFTKSITVHCKLSNWCSFESIGTWKCIYSVLGNLFADISINGILNLTHILHKCLENLTHQDNVSVLIFFYKYLKKLISLLFCLAHYELLSSSKVLTVVKFRLRKWKILVYLRLASSRYVFFVKNDIHMIKIQSLFLVLDSTITFIDN